MATTIYRHGTEICKVDSDAELHKWIIMNVPPVPFSPWDKGTGALAFSIDFESALYEAERQGYTFINS